MTLVLRSILAAALAFSISCSSGGGGGDGAVAGAGGTTDNTAFKNVAGSVLGQWTNDGVMNLFVSDTRLKLVAKCDNNQTVQAEISIKLTQSTITFLESKSAGSGNCSIDFKKDTVMNYTVNGDNLFIQGGEDQQQMAFTRVGGTTPAQGNGGNNGGNNGGSAQGMTLEFYTGQNCTGQKMIYTQGMNCNQLGGNVSSLKQVGGGGAAQCQSTNTPQDSRTLCNTLNQQLSGQGRQ